MVYTLVILLTLFGLLEIIMIQEVISKRGLSKTKVHLQISFQNNNSSAQFIGG